MKESLPNLGLQDSPSLRSVRYQKFTINYSFRPLPQDSGTRKTKYKIYGKVTARNFPEQMKDKNP